MSSAHGNYSSYTVVHEHTCTCTNVHTYTLQHNPTTCTCTNIARRCGREPIKHEVQPSAIFSRDHTSSATFSVMHKRERYFNWFIVATFLASAALNDSKWALRSKLPPNDARREPWQDRWALVTFDPGK